MKNNNSFINLHISKIPRSLEFYFILFLLILKHLFTVTHEMCLRILSVHAVNCIYILNIYYIVFVNSIFEFIFMNVFFFMKINLVLFH